MAMFCVLLQWPAAVGLFMNPGGLRFIYATDATDMWLLAGVMASVPLAALYNGKQGIKLKWLFYASYPVHLSILAAIWLLGVRPSLFN